MEDALDLLGFLRILLHSLFGLFLRLRFSVGVSCVVFPSGLDALSSILVGISGCIPHQRMSNHLRRNLLVGVSVPVSTLYG